MGKGRRLSIFGEGLDRAENLLREIWLSPFYYKASPGLLINGPEVGISGMKFYLVL